MTAKVDPLRDPPSEANAGGAAAPAAPSRIGWLAAGSRPGALLVDYDGNSGGPLAARSVLALDEAAIAAALRTRQPAVLLFENGDARLPIVVGLIAPDPGAALLGKLLAGGPAPLPAPAPPQAPTPTAEPAVAPALEARVDGRRVIIEGQDEVVLKCGDAIITLRRDGKLILRGTYVETHAKGVNRIKGGSVKIN